MQDIFTVLFILFIFLLLTFADLMVMQVWKKNVEHVGIKWARAFSYSLLTCYNNGFLLFLTDPRVFISSGIFVTFEIKPPFTSTKSVVLKARNTAEMPTAYRCRLPQLSIIQQRRSPWGSSCSKAWTGGGIMWPGPCVGVTGWRKRKPWYTPRIRLNPPMSTDQYWGGGAGLVCAFHAEAISDVVLRLK